VLGNGVTKFQAHGIAISNCTTPISGYSIAKGYITGYTTGSQIVEGQSIEEDIEDVFNKVTSTNTASNVSLSNTSEVTIKEWSSVTSTFNVDNFFIDYDAWATAQTGQTAVVKVYSKVDASNYRVIDDITITSEDAYTGLVFNTFSVANDVKITIKPDGNTTETIYYNYVAWDE
jgi:hypothetical protein